jgi:selenocysteine lyase/cysteine desulfurase
MVLGAIAAAGVAGSARARMPERPDLSADALAREEGFWREIAALYETTPEVTNLEGGYWGLMSAPVRAAFKSNIDRLNAGGSVYARGPLGAEMAAVMARLAAFLGVDAEELLLVRSASEALQILIAGYNRLEPGDGVLYADLDYPAMKTAMASLQARWGADVIRVDLPEPASPDAVLGAYEAALDAAPHVKLMLVTHVNNLTGAIHPVVGIQALAQARGVDVIVDAAHAVGQIPVDYRAAGCSFMGANLHKWVAGPIGLGVIWIRRDRIADIDNFMEEPGDPADIRTKAHTGTLNYAIPLTLPAALDVHEALGGAAAKAARLRYLRDLWVEEARTLPGVEILTADDPGAAAAMTSFRLAGKTSRADNDAIARRLLDEHALFTVRRSGPARGDCVRVTPNFWNTADDVARLAPALREILA